MALAEHGGVDGLDGNNLYAGHAGLQHLADAGDGASGADAGDEDVDLAVGVADDLFGCGLAVDLGVRVVLELASENRTRGVCDDLVGGLDGTGHALRGLGEHNLGPKCLEEHATLDRHRRRHRQHDAVAACGANHRERDAGVSAGCFDDRAAWRERPGSFGGVDDRDTDAVLHARSGVEVFELGKHGRLRVTSDAVEANEGSVAERRRDVRVDACQGRPFSAGRGEVGTAYVR